MDKSENRGKKRFYVEKNMVVDFINRKKFKKQVLFAKSDLRTNSVVLYDLDDLIYIAEHNSKHSYVKNVGNRESETPGIYKQLMGAPMGSALAQTLAIGFGCAIERRVEVLLDRILKPLFLSREEYRDFKGLFLSRRYIDDKINFYPGVGNDTENDELGINCLRLEEIAERGFSEEEIVTFRKKEIVEKIKFLKKIYEVYVDRDFYKTPGSTCTLEREKGGNEFCGLKIDLTETLRYRPMEIFKEKINTPPNMSFLRNAQKKGFIIGGMYRSGLYTDPMTWKQNKIDILEEYIKGFKNKGYKEETIQVAIKRCQFLEDKIKQSLIWNLKPPQLK